MEAAALWIEEEIRDGRERPSPSDLAAISKNPAWDGWVVTYVDTDLAHSNQDDAEPVI